MIVTITLNPAIDRTLIVDEDIEFGAINSVVQSYVEVGGRGINVSRAIRALGVCWYRPRDLRAEGCVSAFWSSWSRCDCGKRDVF